MAWLLRITDEVAFDKRADYESQIPNAVAALKDVAEDKNINMQHVNSARVSFGKNILTFVHHVRFETLGDYDTDGVQGSAVCGIIKNAYNQNLIENSRWEWLRIVKE